MVLTAWLLGNSAYSAEVIANEKFDAVVVDMQHRIIDFQSAAELLQAISTKAPVPIARTPWNDPSPIIASGKRIPQGCATLPPRRLTPSPSVSSTPGASPFGGLRAFA